MRSVPSITPVTTSEKPFIKALFVISWVVLACLIPSLLWAELKGSLSAWWILWFALAALPLAWLVGWRWKMGPTGFLIEPSKPA